MVEEFEKIHNETCDKININIALFAIQYFTFFQYHIQSYYKTLYETYPFVNTFTENVYNLLNYVKSMIFNYQIEPFDYFWSCVAYIELNNNNNNNKNMYEYNDYYPHLSYNQKPDPNIALEYDKVFSISKSIKTKSVHEHLILVKFYDKCISRVHRIHYGNDEDTTNDNTNDTKINNGDIQLLPCEKPFVSIVYSHPKMKDVIYLDIDPMFYLNENEILSPVFILRLLKYQKTPFVFDNDYSIEIMDNDINVIHLTNKHYILLHENSYGVVDI
jgi:hypothetical protein